MELRNGFAALVSRRLLESSKNGSRLDADQGSETFAKGPFFPTNPDEKFALLPSGRVLRILLLRIRDRPENTKDAGLNNRNTEVTFKGH